MTYFSAKRYVQAARMLTASIALMGGLLTPLLGTPSTASAADYPPNKPAARLQIVVNNVKIHNDREGIFSGDGEMEFYVGVWRCKNPALPTCMTSSPRGVPEALPNSISTIAEPLARTGMLFNAGTGDTVTLGNVIPGGGGEMWGVGTTKDFGFPVYPGQHYVVQFDMAERDDDVFTNGEYMGYVYQNVTLENLALGTHTVRSVSEDGTKAGDYTVTYEVRMAPAADLRPGYIKVEPVAGGNQSRVCISVINSGTVASDAMFVALQVDGTVPVGGRVDAATLGAGEHGVSCVTVTLPTSGQHTLTAVVDAASTVNEYNELNNELEQSYQGTRAVGPEGAPTPAPTPGGRMPEEGHKPELTVVSVEVNGQESRGKSDCSDGKHSVSVVVKNEGAETAKKVTVQLAVDGGQTATKLVTALQPGEASEVGFEDVRLKKGQQKLTATVDPKNAIDEGDDENNALTVTANCTAR